MPIIHFHLAEGYRAEQYERVLIESSQRYAEVLASPIERIRVFLHVYPPARVAIGGRLSSETEARAPYFHFIVLEGRPLDERHRLLAAFTDLLVEILECDRKTIRGACRPIAPENWAIGGTPASVTRAAEIAARRTTAGED